MKKKITLTIICAVLSCVCLIGTTFAWLMDKTETINNTFTIGNVDITLEETENLDLKMVPGAPITKDPKVGVVAGSEACWLFVTIEESTNLDDFITYTVEGTWKAVPGAENVYYIQVDADTAKAGKIYPVLTGNQVTVNNTVTKAMMDEIKAAPSKAPKLSFTAYAIQQTGFNDGAKTEAENAAAAWAVAKNAT